MNDYYQDLGVARAASEEEIGAPTGGWLAILTRTSTRAGRRKNKFKSQAYDVSRPGKARLRHGRRPVRDGRRRRLQGGLLQFSVMDAFFGGGAAAARGPRPRQQRGQDALVRLDVDLSAAVFGSDEELTVDTAAACGTCGGSGAQPGTGVDLQRLQRARRGADGAALLPSAR